MVGVLLLERLKQVRVGGSVAVGAGPLWHSPATITDIPDALLLVNLVVPEPIGYFAVVSVMLKGGHKISGVKQGRPVLETLFNHIPVILYNGAVTEPFLLSVQEG